MKAILDIKDSKASFIMELLDNFSFVQVQSFDESENRTSKIDNIQKQNANRDFFMECFGMWEDRDIDAKTLRKKAWGIE